MKNYKINWYILMFAAGWIILFFAPVVPYRLDHLSDKQKAAMTNQERDLLEQKNNERAITKAKADKIQLLGYTMFYGGLILSFAKRNVNNTVTSNCQRKED